MTKLFGQLIRRQSNKGVSQPQDKHVANTSFVVSLILHTECIKLEFHFLGGDGITINNWCSLVGTECVQRNDVSHRPLGSESVSPSVRVSQPVEDAFLNLIVELQES